jgi:hypothetical protein
MVGPQVCLGQLEMGPLDYLDKKCRLCDSDEASGSIRHRLDGLQKLLMIAQRCQACRLEGQENIIALERRCQIFGLNEATSL